MNQVDDELYRQALELRLGRLTQELVQATAQILRLQRENSLLREQITVRAGEPSGS